MQDWQQTFVLFYSRYEAASQRIPLLDIFEADEFEVFAFDAPVRCLWFWSCVLGGAQQVLKVGAFLEGYEAPPTAPLNES
jgi:hypothetical protein